MSTIVRVGNTPIAPLSVLDEGGALTQRTSINFVGTGVSASDDAVNGRTVVQVNTGGSLFLEPSASTAAAINTAIATLTAAGGGTVLLPAGTITLDVRLALKDNVSLLGRGTGVTVLQAAAGVTTAVLLGASGDTVSNATYSGFTINAAYSTTGGALNLKGVQISAGTRLRFIDVEIIDTGGSAILLQTGTTDCLVDRCRMIDNGQNLGTSEHTVSITGSSHRNTVKNCNITAHRAMGICAGTSGSGSTDCQFLDNYIADATVTAVGFESIGMTVDCNRTVVRGNICLNSQDNGISVTSNDSTVSGNTINGVVNNGISVGGNRNAITGNVVKNCGREVSGTIHSCISLNSSSGGALNTVTGNVVYDDQATKTTEYGIRESGAAANRNTIVGNVALATDFITGGILTAGPQTVSANNVTA